VRRKRVCVASRRATPAPLSYTGALRAPTALQALPPRFGQWPRTLRETTHQSKEYRYGIAQFIVIVLVQRQIGRFRLVFRQEDEPQ
jgi:hypothetical protein